MHCGEKVLFVANVAVVVISLPPLAPAAEAVIHKIRAEFFPALHELAHRRGADFDEHVDVVRHDDPREQAATVVIVGKENLFHVLSDGRNRQFACAATLVQVVLQPYAPRAFILDLKQRFPFVPPLLRQ